MSGRREALDEFLALYAAGRYWDAHEALERDWRRADEPRMLALQGLIQWAVAFEHVRRGNPAGARRLLAKSWAKLGPAPPDALGLDLRPLRAAHPGLEAALARWEAGGPAPAEPAPPIARLGSSACTPSEEPRQDERDRAARDRRARGPAPPAGAGP